MEQLSPWRKAALWAIMFFEYAVWGAYAATLGKFILDPAPHGLGQKELVGAVFSLLPAALLIVPPLFAQLADRVLNTEWILGILHLMGAAAMFFVSRQTEPVPFFLGLAFFGICYSSTVPLTNSLIFAHVVARNGKFAHYRVGGTVGWAFSGLALTVWRILSHDHPVYGDLFMLAGGFGVCAGILSFALPPTPPSKNPRNPFAFLEAFSMFKDRAFSIFLFISFVVATQLEFYYAHTASFLGAPVRFGGLAIPDDKIPLILSIGQVTEFIVMLSLPFLLKKLGFKWMLAIGVLAWPLRYAVFAFFPIPAAVLPALALHGICFGAFFVAGTIYVDRVAPTDIKASAQALYTMFVMGLGRLIGSFLAGYVQSLNTYSLKNPEMVGREYITTATHWSNVFLVPCVLTVLCAAAFLVFFRPKVSSMV